MPTRAQIGTTLGRWIEREGIRPPDVNDRIGLPRKSTAIYTWLKGKGAPSEAVRAKLAEVTGIPLERLTPNNGVAAEPPAEAKEAERPIQRPREPHEVTVHVQKFGRTVSFTAELKSAMLMLELLVDVDARCHTLTVKVE